MLRIDSVLARPSEGMEKTSCAKDSPIDEEHWREAFAIIAPTLRLSEVPKAIRDVVRLGVHDNGTYVTGKYAKRLGLPGMRECVETVDRSLAVVSAPGISVCTEIPFRNNRRGANP